MAAGSVMNEPSSGTKVKMTKYIATLSRRGSRRAKTCTICFAVCSTGRVPATTMMTNTNMGSVKLRPLI